MPLGYWDKQGMDADRIAKNTPKEDIKWSNQLGWTYRVQIVSDTRGRRLSQQALFSLANSKKRRGAPKALPQPAAAQPRPAATEKDSSSDSSDSSGDSSNKSSSNSDGAGGGRRAPEAPEEPVETPAQKKARLTTERAQAKAAAAKAKAAAKAAEKAAQAIKNKATKLRTRLVTALNSLRSAVSNPLILEIPPAITTPVRDFLATFERLIAVADEAVAGQHVAWPSVLDTAPFTDARKSEQLLLGILKGVAKSKGVANQ